MKTFIYTILSLLLSSIILAQNPFEGSWEGALDVQGHKLPIIFHITKSENGYTTTFDSPAQFAFGIETKETIISDNKIEIIAPSLNINYKGTLTNGEIKGTFTQNILPFPLSLKKVKDDAKKGLNRPQTPKPPFDYYTEDVKFPNDTEGNILAGTIAQPKNFDKNQPILVMITGSGAQNRNSELFGHKPFLVIADYLAKNGIATLRLDDRGVGESERGNIDPNSENFADDINSAVHFLKNKGYKNIGLIGHSEGGMIAPIVASKNKSVRFLVLLAAPGIPITDLLIDQNEKLAKLNDVSSEDIKKYTEVNTFIYDYLTNNQTDKNKEELVKTLKNNFDTEIIEQIIGKNQENLDLLFSNWFLYFIKFNPKDYLEKIEVPVLAINGSLDMQVSAKENLKGITDALKKAQKVSHFDIIEMDKCNHLLQTATTGNPYEYTIIEETINPEVLEIITEWIHKLKTTK